MSEGKSQVRRRSFASAAVRPVVLIPPTRPASRGWQHGRAIGALCRNKRWAILTAVGAEGNSQLVPDCTDYVSAWAPPNWLHFGPLLATRANSCSRCQSRVDIEMAPTG